MFWHYIGCRAPEPPELSAAERAKMPLPKCVRLSYARTGYSVSFLSDARTSSKSKERPCSSILQHDTYAAPCTRPTCIQILGIKMALRMNAALLSVALALLSSRGDAFSTPASAFVGRSRTASAAAGPLHMSDKEKKDVTFDTKTQKELTYDAASGRFFETGDSVECIPEDEYCAVDKETGEMIRLTVEEKERIFLDALQVSPRHNMCSKTSCAGLAYFFRYRFLITSASRPGFSWPAVAIINY